MLKMNFLRDVSSYTHCAVLTPIFRAAVIAARPSIILSDISEGLQWRESSSSTAHSGWK